MLTPVISENKCQFRQNHLSTRHTQPGISLLRLSRRVAGVGRRYIEYFFALRNNGAPTGWRILVMWGSKI